MAGTQVPLVLLPRYTTYSGADQAVFTTIGMDVSEYDKAILSFWRSAGKDLNAVAINFQESNDQNLWSTCGGGPFNDPTANTEAQFQPVITKRWFRISITIQGVAAANCVATCWCIGFLEQREA